MGIALSLVAAVALIAANAFFVAVEFALVAVDRSAVELEAADGSRRARLVSNSLSRLSFHLSGLQLGITVCSVLLGFVAAPAVAELLGPLFDRWFKPSTSATISVIVALALATVVQMVLGELVPKAVAVSRPLRTATALSFPTRVFVSVFRPVIALFGGAADRAVRALGIEPQEELSTVRSRSELAQVVRSSSDEGTLEEQEASLLTRVFRFGEKTVADVLTPRTSIEALPETATGADLLAASARTGHSRFPVYRVDLDDIVGVCLVKALLEVDPAQRRDVPVADLMGAPFVVPETRDLDHLLLDMRDRATSLAVVGDEYGGTAGLVTLEDLLEEIVGEIDDEYDLSGPAPAGGARPEGLSGSLHPDEVLEACGFAMPDGEFETLAGLLLDRIGSIPAVGDSVDIDGWAFTVTAMDRRRIATVRVVPPVASEPT